MLSSCGLYRAGVVNIEEIPFHICKSLVIIYVNKGEIELSTTSGATVLKEKSIDFLNVKEPIMMKKVSENAELIFVSFEEEFLKNFEINFENVTFNCNLSNFFEATATDENKIELKIKFASLLSSIYSKKEIFLIEEEMKKIIEFIVATFDDVSNLFSVGYKDATIKDRFCRISEYMIDNVSNKMSLSDIADREHLSLQYLSREFSEKLNKTYNEVINYYRVINAIIQLLDSDNNLTYIGENSGFSSIRHYNKTFREIMGCLPSTFRKSYYGRKSKVWIKEYFPNEMQIIIENIMKDAQFKNSDRFCENEVINWYKTEQKNSLDKMISKSSCTSFDSKEIDLNLYDKIIEIGSNFVTEEVVDKCIIIKITDNDKKEGLAKIYSDGDVIRYSPLVLLFCIDLREFDCKKNNICKTEDFPKNFGELNQVFNTGLYVQAINMTAIAFGFSTTYIKEYLFSPQDVRKMFELAEHVVPMACLSLGYSKDN